MTANQILALACGLAFFGNLCGATSPSAFPILAAAILATPLALFAWWLAGAALSLRAAPNENREAQDLHALSLATADLLRYVGFAGGAGILIHELLTHGQPLVAIAWFAPALCHDTRQALARHRNPHPTPALAKS